MSKPLRNFDKFEEGHYYVYTGEKSDKWAKRMYAVLDHKIHKCLETPCSNKEGAIFEGVEDGYWNYKDGFDNWIEVESPDAIFEVGDDVLRYDKMNKSWEISKVTKDYFEWDYNKNGCESVYSFYYICKRKHNKKEEPKENVPRETPIKMSLGAIQSDLNLHPIWLTTKALSEWMNLWTDKRKDADKKDNVFKKYIRTKKYMKFVKEKK